jgi:hypothetical protein
VNLTLDSGVGMLKLSDGPGDYHDQMDCKWNVEAQGPITVVFTDLNTKDGDVLTITEPGGTPQTWSGDLKSLPQSRRSFTSKAARITVTFTSNLHTSKAKSVGATAGFRLELYPTAVPITNVAGAALLPHTYAHTACVRRKNYDGWQLPCRC